MELDQSLLERVAAILSQSTNPDQTVQQTSYAELESLSERPDFLLYLLKLIDDGQNGSSVLAASLFRRYLKSASPEMIHFIEQAAGPILLKACASPQISLVRQVASLAAAIYRDFQIPILGNVGEICVAFLKNEETVPNGLWIAFEILTFGIDLGEEFACVIHSFLLTEYSDLVLQIANLMTPLHTEVIRSSILPLAFQNLDKFSDIGIREIVQIVGYLISIGDYSELFIEFLLSALEKCEMVALAAAKVFRVHREMPLQPKAVVILFSRLGEDEDLNSYNLSNVCLDTLRCLLVNHGEVSTILMPLIEEGFKQEKTIVNAIRAMAVLQEILPAELVAQVWSSVIPYIGSPNTTSASYCLSRIALSHPEFQTQALKTLFEVLLQSPPETRIHVEGQLSELVAHLDGLPSEPYIEICLEVLKTVGPDEIISMFFLIGNMCQAIGSFEGDPHVAALMELGMKAFKEENALFIGSIHLFGNLLVKCPSMFVEIIRLTSDTVLNCLDSVDGEHSLYLWLWTFLRNAVVGASAAGADINAFLLAVCEKVHSFLTFQDNPFVRGRCWYFILALFETGNTAVCGAIITTIMTVIVNTSMDEDLHVLGKIAEVLYIILDFFQGKLESPLAVCLMNLMTEGYRYNVSDENLDRQNIASVMLKLFSLDQHFVFDASSVQDLMNTLCAMENGKKKAEAQKYFSLLFAKQAART